MDISREKIEESGNNITYAYFRFSSTRSRVNLLLDASRHGLDDKLSKINSILDKLNDPEGTIGICEKAEKFQILKREDGMFEFNLGESELEIMKCAMEHSRKEHSEVDTYLYSVLLVFIWGAFEAYCTMLFGELFIKQPLMLKTNDKISYCEIIENISNPLELLIEKELNKIGHFKIKEMVLYFKEKVKFSFTPDEESKMKEIYNIRNIIAHATGIVRSDAANELPKSISIKENEILLSKEYLDEAVEAIFGVVERIQKHIELKFSKNKVEFDTL